MFPKQVNFRELFSNPGAYLSHKPGESSESQNSSQLLFSQFTSDSLDQGSQNSHTNSPGKMFYLHHATDRGLNKQNHQENLRSQIPSSVKLTNQLYNNISRAKDRDERDLLVAVLNTIRETTDEVLKALTKLHDDINQTEKTNNNQLEVWLEKVSELFTKSNKELIEMLKIREFEKSEEIKLREQLTEKGARLAELEDQLHKSRERNVTEIIEKLEHISKAHHLKTQEILKEIYNQHKQDFKNLYEMQHEEQMKGLKEIQHHYNEIENWQKVHLNDNISRISLLDQNLQEVIRQSKMINQKMTEDIEQSIKHMQKQFKLEVEKLLENQIKSLSKSSYINSAFKKQKGEMCKCFQQFTAEVCMQLQKVLDNQESILTSIIKKCLLVEKECNEKKYQELQNNIQESIEHEIGKIEMCYKDQINKILSQFRNLPRIPTNSMLPASVPSPMPEQFKEQISLPASEDGKAPEIKTNFVETTEDAWPEKLSKTSQNIFKETSVASFSRKASQLTHCSCMFSDRCLNPSPVATVYPQLQSKQVADITTKQFMPKLDTQCDEATNINRIGKGIEENCDNVANKAILTKVQMENEIFCDTSDSPVTTNKKANNPKVKRRKQRRALSRPKKMSTIQPEAARAYFPLDCNSHDKENEALLQNEENKSDDNQKSIEVYSSHRYLLRQRANRPVSTKLASKNQPFVFLSDTVANGSKLEMRSYTYSTASYHKKSVDAYSDVDKLITASNMMADECFPTEKTHLGYKRNVSPEQSNGKSKENMKRRHLSEKTDYQLCSSMTPASTDKIMAIYGKSKYEDLDSSDKEESCQSQESSPSVSINEVIIRKKLKTVNSEQNKI